MNLQGRNLLKEIDLTAAEFTYLIDLRSRLRMEKRMGLRGRRLYERRGLTALEVTEEVFESRASIVFDQAANRLPAIRLLLGSRAIVVCAGGGGVPVVASDGGLRGVEAVVDKDLTTSLLARQLDADALLLLTDVAAVQDGHGTPQARPGPWSAGKRPGRQDGTTAMGPCAAVSRRDQGPARPGAARKKRISLSPAPKVPHLGPFLDPARRFRRRLSFGSPGGGRDGGGDGGHVGGRAGH